MITLQVLGPVRISDTRGRAFDAVLAQPKRLALLAYLAVAGIRGPVSRDLLIGLFWPDADDEHARNSLSQVLTYLRRALGAEVFLTSNGDTVAINPQVLTSDAVEFEQLLALGELEPAVRLYRGDFCEGFFVSGAPTVEAWTEEKRRSYRNKAAAATAKLSESCDEAGNAGGALHWARHWLAFAPENEAALRRVMVLLDQHGETAEAIALYQTFSARLATEYELEPGAETSTLALQLRSRQDERQATVGAQLRKFAAPPAARRSYRMVLGGIAVILVVSAYAVLLKPSRSALGDKPVLIAAFENQTGDRNLDVVGSLAADWITRGLQQTALVRVIDPATALIASRGVLADSSELRGLARAAAMARAADAEIVVWGAYHQRDDTLYYRAHITDMRSGRVLFSIDPIATTRRDPTEGAELLLGRVAGAIATLLNETKSSTIVSPTRPPLFRAYQEHLLGVEQFQRNAYDQALRHFQTSARLDTMFSTPLIWAAFALGNMNEAPDSLVSVLAARRDRLIPLERHALAYFEANARTDVSAMLDAARSAARLSPGSEWSHHAARLALAQNHPREALKLAADVDPQHGWAKGWAPYWGIVATAHHLLGEYRAELEVSRRAIRMNPEIPFLRTYEIRALVGLGRVDAARQRIEEMMLVPARAEPPGQLLWPLAQELWVHGHQRHARDVWHATTNWCRSPAAEMYIESRPDTGDARRIINHNLARGLYSEGLDVEARTIYESIAAKYPDDIQSRLYLGYLAARQNDERQAAQRLREIEAADVRLGGRIAVGAFLVPRARMYALAGNVDAATQLLRDIAPKNTDAHFFAFLHREPDWDALRKYEPFLELTRP